MSAVKVPRKRFYYCLASNKTRHQLGQFQSNNLELSQFCKQTGDQYCVATVVIAESYYMRGDWHLLTKRPEDVIFRRQFLTENQARLLNIAE
jgi:hypothetical protein